MKKNVAWILTVFFLTCIIPGITIGADKLLKMSTTTSTENSGLLDVLLPQLEKDTGIQVKVIAKGTGAAIRDGMDGNVDIIFVHAKSREEKFVKDGYGAYRLGVMHNDFVIVGPDSDPAGIKGKRAAAEVLTVIGKSKAKFISRGDDSHTHQRTGTVESHRIILKDSHHRNHKKGEKTESLLSAPGRTWKMVSFDRAGHGQNPDIRRGKAGVYPR